MLIEKESLYQDYFKNLVIETDSTTQKINFYILKYDTKGGLIYIPELNTAAFVENIELACKMVVGVKGIDGTGNGSWYGPGAVDLTGGSGSSSGGSGSSSGGGSNYTNDVSSGVYQQTCITVMMCNEPWPEDTCGNNCEHQATSQCSNTYPKDFCNTSLVYNFSNNTTSSTSNGSSYYNSTGNSTTSTTPTNPITVTVIPLDTEENIKEDMFLLEFYNPLSQNKKEFLQAHNPIYKDLKNYLVSEINFANVGNCIDDDNEAFAEEVLDKIMLNPTLFTSIKPFLIEKQIDDNLLDPCSKSVFQQIKNTTNCDFANVLAKLNANDKTYNTTLISAVAPSQQPGQTIWNSPYNYTIYVSTDYANKTKLFIAGTILHELVHAYFMSLFDDFHNVNPSNLDAYNDFAYLFSFYVKKEYPTSTNSADIHHQQMATDYVAAIAASLKEYAIATGTPSTLSNLDQICSDLAWRGLKDAPVFNVLFPEGSSERLRIENRYTSEIIGSPYGTGTPNEQTPIGEPCN